MFDERATEADQNDGPRWHKNFMAARALRLPWLAILAVAAFLMLPHLFAAPRVERNVDGSRRRVDKSSWTLGLPRIYSGDEPHYLVQLYSLVEDGDLELRNNYDGAERGTAQTGKSNSGNKFGRHTTWYRDGVFYEFNENSEAQTVDGTSEAAPVRHREYSRHPPGLAWLLWPATVWFRGTDLVEPVAILCCGLAVVISVYFYALLVAPYATDKHMAAWTLVLVFLGTPIWHYGRALFTEPMLTAFGIVGVALYLRKSQWLISGTMFAIAALLKPPFGLVAVPFAIDLAMRRNIRGTLMFCGPMALAIAATLANNYAQHGSPLATSQQWEWSNPIIGFFGQLFSWRKGLFLFAPVLLIAVFWWPRFYRAFPRDAGLMLAAAGLYFIAFACFKYWDGGFCYGPRHLTPVLPLLLVPVATIRREDFIGKPMLSKLLTCVLLLSLLVNFVGAVPYWTSWNIHPVIPVLARILR
jgi:hypothetical protein